MNKKHQKHLKLDKAIAVPTAIALLLLVFVGGTLLGLHLKAATIKSKDAQVTTLISQLKQAKSAAATYKSYYQGELGANNVAQADIVQLNAQIRNLKSTPVVVYTAPTLVPPAALGGY